MSLITGIEAYYKMEGNSDDATSNGNNGTDTAITYGTAYGKINEGASFNGTTSEIDIASSSSLNPTNITVSCWMKTGTSQNNKCLVGKWQQSDTTYSYLIQFSPTGTNNVAGIVVIGGTAYTAYTPSGNSYDDNSWHFIVMTFDGTSLIVYADNIAGTTVSASGNIQSSTTSATIGSYGKATTQTFFTGDIDEVGIWNRALSSTEVSELYNGGSGLTYPFGISTYTPSPLPILAQMI